MQDENHGMRRAAGLCLGGVILMLAWLGWYVSTVDPDRSIPRTASETSAPGGLKGWRATQGNRSAEQIVAAKVHDFAQNRRKIAKSLAVRAGVDVPEEVSRFFDAVEIKDWPEIDRIFSHLHALMSEPPRPADLEACWPTVMETIGCAAEARKWPPDQLLDYADAVLGSLRSGMVYIGGTDPGRFIPTLINETSAGEHHIVLTQNALADRLYLDYVGFLYGERMTALTEEEQKAAFDGYIADARQRLEHDTKFPEEPAHIEPGEIIRFANGVDGEVIAEGQISVMAVNERLLKRLMDKNPDLSFAVEESFPMKSTYPGAALLGPIMELRAENAGNELTSQRAAEALNVWRERADQVIANNGNEASNPVKTWSKMAAAHANLMKDRQLFGEAEQAYRLAQQIYPGCPEATFGLASLLAARGNSSQARELIEEFQLRHSFLQPPPELFPRVTSQQP